LSALFGRYDRWRIQIYPGNHEYHQQVLLILAAVDVQTDTFDITTRGETTMKQLTSFNSRPLLIPCAVAVFLLAASYALPAFAGVSTEGVGYQGRLTDASDNPVPDGPKDLILSIWTDSVGGTMLFSELRTVTTSQGLFTTCIGCGSSTFPGVFDGQTLFLQTQVSGQAPMTPRAQLRGVPYSLSAASVHGGDIQGAPAARGIRLYMLNKNEAGSEPKGLMRLDLDEDGDGHPDYVVADSVTTAMAGRLTGHDLDGDGAPEIAISQTVSPTTSGVAIRAKGTGADKDRSMSITATTNGISSAVQRSDYDDDGDGVPEQEISQTVTPTTSGVAIKTKGTGADKDRSSIISTTGRDSATVVASHDIDGDGIPETSITQACDSSQARAAYLTKKGYVAYSSNKDLAGRMTIATNLNDTTIDMHGEGRLGIGKPVDATKRIDVAGGAYCDGTNWVNASDAHAKENFQAVDGAVLLDKIADLEITKWNYKGDAATEHIGPTAQNFQKTFGVGSDGKSISTIDPSGIALAAIKELNRRNATLEKENQTLRREMEDLKRLVQKLASDH
jgi:hypothetical protein